MRASGVLAAVVAAAAAALVAVLPAPHGADEPRPAARAVPVQQAVSVCPPLPVADSEAAAAVTAAPLPTAGEGAAEAAPRAAELTPARVRADGTTYARLARRGEVWRATADALARGFTVDAQGALAAGLTGTVAASVDGTTGPAFGRAAVSGLVSATCAGPSAESWYVGAGSSVGRRSVLALANTSTGTAVAELRFHGPDGPVEAAGNGQVVLDAAEQQVLPLEDLVPGVPELAVQVLVRQGQVASTLLEAYPDGSTPSGVDTVGAAVAPATEVAVTGIPAGAGRRTLTVVNAGDSETVVGVEVLGATGAFEPADFEVLSVPAGAVVTRDVSALTRREISGLRLRADQPISASVRTAVPEPADVAHAAAGPALTSGGAVALPEGVEATLVLTARGEVAVTADVTVHGAAGRALAEETVELARGQTRSLPVTARRGSPAAVVVRNDQGSGLIGSLVWRTDSGLSVTSVQPLRTTVQVPALRADPVGP